MSAIREAAALYERYEIVPGFQAVLADHLENGIVVSTPGSFLMAKAVQLEDERLAWHITAGVGNFRTPLAILPWWLPFVSFYRRGKQKLKVYRTEQFIRHARNINHVSI